MNSDNSPFKKRKFPYEAPVETPTEPEVKEEPVENQEIYEEVEEYEEPREVYRPQPRQQQVKRPVRQTSRQQFYPVDDVNREKYTSTMDVMLRRQIKIVCATRGIMFAKFVEDACREKLEREGVR